MFALGLAILLCIASLLQVAVGQPVISRIDPAIGSLAGGARLVIYGNNFGDMYTTSRSVYIGPYPCNIISHYSSNEVLTCETSPGSAALKAVLPRAGPPGTEVFIYGDRTAYMMYRDCVESNWGDMNCVGSILFGDYLCRQDPADPDSPIIMTTNPRLGPYLYRIGCTMPAQNSNNTQPALGKAASLNATIHFEASMRGGAPTALPSSFLYNVDSVPYQFQLYPEVTGVSPATGSNAGGTLVKVTGRGFPDLRLGMNDTIAISIAGVPCDIVNSTYDTLFCVTGPKPAATVSPIGGLYPAMRGIEYEFYNISRLSYGNLWQLNNTIKVQPLNGSYRAVLTGSWEGNEYSTPYYCSRSKAFFTAPRAGNYSFYMSADDYAQLNGTWKQSNGALVSTTLINLQSWTYIDNFFQSPSQRSLEVTLNAGQSILLEMNHCNGASVGFTQLAVRMPVPEPRLNSLPEIQKISISATFFPRSVAIKYLYGDGAAVTAFNITISALNDTALDDPQIGLYVQINGGWDIVLPLGATTGAMDDLVEASLGGNFTKNDTLFGIRKTRAYGTLTLQMAALDGSMGSFNVTAARLVLLPPPPPPMDNTCPSNSSAAINVTSMYPPPAPQALQSAGTGFTVNVSRAQAVPAVVPTGDFLLGLYGNATTSRVSATANSTAMVAAIQNVTGYNSNYYSVNVTNAREGAYFARIWNITFTYSWLDNVPALVVGPSSTTPPGVLLTMESRSASPRLKGSFKVAFGSSCASVKINLGDSSETIEAALGSLPGLAPPKQVDVSGDGTSGYVYTITFDPINNPGDQPELRIADASDLQGVNPTGSITTVWNGTTDAFYAPIPTEFLRLAVSQPGTINLQVNGVPSACADASGICGFLYSDAATPRITGVSPTRLAFSSQASLPLTITGSGFSSGPSVEVRVGTALCNVTSVTATQITCNVPDTAPAGVRLVSVNVAGLGFADGAPNVTLETLYVTGSAPSPAVLSSAGISVLNFTGKGFDYVDCANNKLTIGGVRCSIIKCQPNMLTVIYPGNNGANAAAASVTAEVYEKGQLIDSDTPSGLTVSVSSSAPSISTVSPARLPGAGGVITWSLTGATASQVISASMVPFISSFTNYTEASVAFQEPIPCTDVTAGSSGTLTCISPALRNGRYHILAVLSSGLQLLSSDTILFELFITSVSPNLGSIGGGTTLTITGSGFSQVVSENVVFITVPVSTTFLNGVVQCIATSVTSTTLTCKTLPNLAADASANDPFAKQVMPVDTTPGRAVSVVICDSSYNSSFLQEYCWSLPETARARCDAAGAATCNFGYSTELTPAVDYLYPSSGSLGTRITVVGSYLNMVTEVQFLQGGVLKGAGSNIISSRTNVSCDAPDLPPGVYTILLLKANGEKSVDPYGKGTFTFTASIDRLTRNVGSLAGGLPLVLSVGGAGLAVGPDNLTANAITIADLPCPILSVKNRTEVTCRAPGMNGYVFAEYWNLGVSTSSMPDIFSFTKPHISRIEKGTSFSWGTMSPEPGVINFDYWAARFTFYYQISVTENVTFYMYADDDARLYIDDVLVGGRNTPLDTILYPGLRKLVVTHVEYNGGAYLSVVISRRQPNGARGPFAYLEWQKVTPVPPGTPLPVKLTVNGIDSVTQCPVTNLTLVLPGQPKAPFEPSWVQTPNRTCSYVYSVYRTPSLSALSGITLSGIMQPTFNSTNTTLSIFGDFLTDPSLPAASQISVTLANRLCSIVGVAPVTVNGTNTTNINCTAPALPAGQWPVSIMVEGLGLTRPTATAATDLPIVTYTVRVLSYTFNNPNSKCYFSLFGGGTFNITGYGFVKDLVDTTLQVNMTAAWETVFCGSGFSNSPPCQAVNSSRLNLVPLASDGFTASFGLTRFKVPNPEAFAGNNSISGVNLRYKPRVYYTSNGTYAATASIELLYFCGGRTPALSGVTPSSAPPDAGATLSLTWYLSGVGTLNNIITAPAAKNGASNATVEFEVGPTVLPCRNPVVTDFNITSTTYREAISCTMPAYMPAATYTLWLCIQPFGCGLLPAYTIPLTISAMSATTGGSAGGITVVITGKGFDTNTTLVSVRFGNSTCKVISSTATSLTCVTGPLDTKPVSPVTWPLSITPTAGTNETTLSNFTFTFDPALESTVSGIVPARGSTEGGTPVTITGADFRTGVSTTVSIGDVACQSVVVVNSTAITCTTGKPPNSILRVPLPVTVLQQGRGYARSSAQYQYIDVWSRNSTWGGGPLPGYEDSVVIPAGVTVLLDISPPKLYVIVLEGNLVFDDTKDYINLQAHYIIVKGGNFTIGSAEKPYPGRANITMHGAPNSRDLPMYGAKALAVRQGVVTFFGQPKIPHYTKLNRTADPGDTSIVVNGAINWQVGDRIVIASSSFYGNEVDEATITALDNRTVSGCTVITLDTPLQYVHLGELHSVQGSTPLDMRAEVAVLTRNILLQGDYTSAKNMYGVQVMVNSPSYLTNKGLVRFDNIEITQSGQAFRLGRYSMHWHLMGDVAWQTWVRGCAIHHTYNRAITVHGTHRAIIQNVTAYHTMGHTFFLEDGIESGNLIEGNLAIHVKVSDALLNTDTSPAAFWITNPNNTVRNNVAAGSAAYGYWYRMLDNPEGPSYTTTICPKFTPLLEFTNNTAHSSMFYGLRIHPEFYPRNVPCNGFSGTFEQVPAVFNGLVAYKNGMKGAVGTQVGMVQLVNVIAGDNGGGPQQHVVNGKDHGGDLELSWVVDDRSRVGVQITEMAGIVNATIYSRTSVGKRGSAGQWPSCRRVAGIITQSPVKGDPKHSALMSLINVTFVDFKGWDDCTLFSMLEACGKCKDHQGGSTTFTANISIITSDNSSSMMSYWSWGHQGVYLDTDGTLLNNKSLPASLLPNVGTNVTLGPGATWHSSVESELFDPNECKYVRNTRTSNNGAYCSPGLSFRRVMLHDHTPQSIGIKDLILTSVATNRSSLVHFTKYNEFGYQFTIATARDYWVQWDMPFRVDPETYELHKMDLMNTSDYVYITTKHIQVKDHFSINNNDQWNNLTAMPPPTNSTHGMFYYNKTKAPNSWWWSNLSYYDTKFTVFVDGRLDTALDMKAFTCPNTGCTNVPDAVVDTRNNTLYWSNTSTWNTSAVNNFRKPVAGDNVTIPYGWDLVIDESTPPLLALTVQGNLRFDTTRDINLTATYIIVMGQGVLSAGSATEPHPAKATIRLKGARDTPDYGIDNNFNLGSKVLAALAGGTINLYGKPARKRWIKLGSAAQIGNNAINVSDPNHGWSVGDKILITSTSFNWNQSEFRIITGIRNNGSQLLLDSPLAHPHGARVKAYPGGPTVDMRAEVGLVSSNVLITADDGESTHSYNGEMFGARVVVSGNSTGRFDSMGMAYCGQAGFDDRACIYFDRMAPVTVMRTDNVTKITTVSAVPNPSFVKGSVLLYGMASNVLIYGNPSVASPVTLADNIMYEAFDKHSVDVQTRDNVIRSNLVIGTIKNMTERSGNDVRMPSSFRIVYASNWVTDNVAAGSERYGFAYYGLPCSNFTNGSFRNNTAHSSLAGLWFQASPEALLQGCAQLTNFTTYMNWDFGIISTHGVSTDIVLKDVNILDTKHAGIHLMRYGEMTDKGWMRWDGGLLVGQSSNDVCSACTKRGDPGCHPKMSLQSFNQYDPFTPAVGLQSSQFALGFAVGPEKKPFDKPMGYSLIHGMFNISGITLADFLGPAGCGGSQSGTYALANQPKAPEAFYPHYFSKINVQNVSTGVNQGMFYHTPPDPDWRNEADCGEAVYTRPDGSQIKLNCAGPAHAYWRDLDGSLTGTVSTTAGIFTSKRVFPMDQGSPVLPGACTYSEYQDSYQCVVNSTSYIAEAGLDLRYKPDPVPADGIWGDPQMLVLESRDKDTEDRNFGPVFFNVSGSIDLVTAAMDHGWCFAYTCQKRLSTFWTYVPTGQTVYINFTRTPSQSFRIWFPYADPDKEIVLVINMLYTLNRRFTWLPPGNGNTTGRVMPLDKPIRIGDGTPHGSYFWDQDNALLYVKIKGGMTVETRTESAVMVSQSFAVTIDNFYAQQAVFLKNLAAVMGIDMNRLYVAKIVAGSVSATIGLEPDKSIPVDPLLDNTVSAAVDPTDPVVTDPAITAANSSIVAVFVVRRRAKGPLPVLPSGSPSTSEVSSSMSSPPAAGRPGSASTRQAFVATNPAYETPGERAAALPASVAAVPVQGPEENPTSPRASVLAAGPTPLSPAQFIGPLASTARMPHSSLPLVPPRTPVAAVDAMEGEAMLAPGASVSVAAAASGAIATTASGSVGGSRSPAQLTPGQPTTNHPSDTTVTSPSNMATGSTGSKVDSAEIEQVPDHDQTKAAAAEGAPAAVHVVAPPGTSPAPVTGDATDAATTPKARMPASLQ
ncbi:hypothetical protein VOLCADRAFT_92358 [Volvox carteri f. nagariensis]|uniref:Fibrocystin-L n=1 Tax=Volvox carteri f. nagariensis TaxID=3068 RepID=D8TZG3_VOLCA|nr:uncharacterized protein VOLCADRAFT_92358 [Volvox carteri f. nagariensis]EFJ47178.1 hypothetical protein VOLCADRAFT_92358 [Volvox carteri f. nagariensis]|eukprot:XP_002951727.1 hypothetical protein VOLCADRAFT_92358 [Volvox carteri f. nagariensis]